MLPNVPVAVLLSLGTGLSGYSPEVQLVTQMALKRLLKGGPSSLIQPVHTKDKMGGQDHLACSSSKEQESCSK